MKCIRCNHDSKYKERSDRLCPNCRRPFAFEPKAGDPLTDVAFAAAIDAVSAHGQVRWGVEHLYYEVCRRYRRKIASAKALFIWSLILAVAGGLFAWNSKGGWALLALTAAAAIFIAAVIRASSHGPALSQEKFNSLWKQWVATHGNPDGLIVRASQPMTKSVEPDIADYSFDRAVICDRARTVDLLLANNFHFENNCAVLTINGYPKGPFEAVKKMLKRNPKLQVFALHDATVLGCRMAHRLSTDPGWFAGQGSVTDVGLGPAQTKQFDGLFLPGEQIAAVGNLSREDAAWLTKHSLELAVIRPEQVLKRLFRAINRKTDSKKDDDDTDSASTTGDGAGGFDSFG